MAPKTEFTTGSVEGVHVGMKFSTLSELKNKRVHNQTRYHISKGLVNSVLLSHLDEDSGDIVTMTYNNVKAENVKVIQAFQNNMRHDVPVRVVRSFKQNYGQYYPLVGYRYDGLYSVQYMHDTDVDKTRRWKIRLTRLPNQPLTWDPPPAVKEMSDDEWIKLSPTEPGNVFIKEEPKSNEA